MERRKERGSKPAMGAWMARKRAERGWTQRDVVAALTERGHPWKLNTLYKIESGLSNPGPAVVIALEQLYDDASPLHPPETPSLDSIATDLREILAALRRLEAVVGSDDAAKWAAAARAAEVLQGEAAPAAPEPAAPPRRGRGR